MLQKIKTWLAKRIFKAEWESVQSQLRVIGETVNSLAEDRRRTRRFLEEVLERESRVKKQEQEVVALLDIEEMRRERQVCQSKYVYKTQEGAQYAGLALYYHDGRFVKEYQCRACPYWHLTHADKPSKLVAKELVTKEVIHRLNTSIGERCPQLAARTVQQKETNEV